MILYHGGTVIIKNPKIISHSGGRDFGMGFYCTDIRSQAEKWARRQGKIRKQTSVLNIYEFDIDNARQKLNFKTFEDYSQEWLEMVINCRNDRGYIHGFDIVHGKIANDDVGETVQAIIDGFMPIDLALQKLKFMPSNNQYCFCTENSLAYIGFNESEKLE